VNVLVQPNDSLEAIATLAVRAMVMVSTVSSAASTSSLSTGASWPRSGAAGGPTVLSRICAAIVDRLTFNGAIIETGTDSYRLAHTRAQ
jgi:hypothetical protein